MANRLAGESSLYLRQHAHQEVDWWPWCDEAFAEARARNVPIFLSIGYSSCHWCHVMSHEVFDDPEVAKALREEFVSIKVDREERPDLDDAYMIAVQAATGRGGWPMSLFLDHERRPIFAGMVLRKAGFLNLLGQLGQAWASAPDAVAEAAHVFQEHITHRLESKLDPFSGPLDRSLLGDAQGALESEFDAERGGFGGAPKFPPHTALELLLKLGNAKATDMALATLRHMALGGIHDVIGGGIHRYSTDADWVLPHFEKLLADNGQLLTALSLAYPLASESDRNLLRCFAEGTKNWILGEMQLSGGWFAHALDADTDGQEGATYTWSIEEAPTTEFAECYGMLRMGNFAEEESGRRTGQNVLIWSGQDSPALASGWRFARELDQLRAVRFGRPQPARDEKAVASANGLALRGLADWARVSSDEDTLRSVQLSLEAWAGWGEDLPHMVVDGKPVGSAFLDDVASLAMAARSAGFQEAEDRWVAMLARFDSERGPTTTHEGHESWFGRAYRPLDAAVPSPLGLALRLRALRGEDIEPTLREFSGWMHQFPHATETLHLALLEFLG